MYIVSSEIEEKRPSSVAGLVYLLSRISAQYHIGQGIQKLTKQNLWKTAFKKVEMIWFAYRPYNFTFFKGCPPQILLGSFLNTLTHMKLLHLTRRAGSLAEMIVLR